MKFFLTLLSIVSFTVYSQLNAQLIEVEKDLKTVRKDSVDGWRKGGIISLNGSNVGLINWAAGGQNSISINGLLGGYANLKQGKLTWDNSLDIGYGMLLQGDNGWMKTDDRIDLTSKLGRQVSNHWYAAGLLNFRTQMTDGFNYPNDSVKISTFFAPAYLLGAVGMDFKVSDKFSLFAAPVTAKMTFVTDQTLADAGAFGVEEATYDALGVKLTDGRNFRSELGGYIRAQFRTKLGENARFTTKLDLFSNYLENPQNIDVNWETLLEVKLWKFISMTFATHLIYDDDIDITTYNSDGNVNGAGPRTQFKHVLGIGLSWKIDK